MDVTISRWVHGYSAEALGEIAALWNANARERHAYYPWTGEMLRQQLAGMPQDEGVFFEARVGKELAGFAYTNMVRESGYPRVGTVEMLMVDRNFRNNGIGSKLLDAGIDQLRQHRHRPEFLDALGAWPFGYAFNVLADGSERSGVFLREAGLYRLFRRAGFEPVRKSLVMRASLDSVAVRPAPANTFYHVAKRTDNTWLDRVFRSRELYDHYLVGNDSRILSRAIFGLMQGESQYENKTVFSLFGVSTPEAMRGRGYAGINISRLMDKVNEIGAETMELHVYADNTPALRLYESLGFKKIAETMMMHKRF